METLKSRIGDLNIMIQKYTNRQTSGQDLDVPSKSALSDNDFFIDVGAAKSFSNVSTKCQKLKTRKEVSQALKQYCIRDL